MNMRPRQIFSETRALDAMSLSVAGLRDGVGPLLTVFLIQHAGLLGTKLSWALAMPAIVAMCFQIPVGRLYDSVADKRYVLALGAAMMATAASFLRQAPAFEWLLGWQALSGLAASILSVGIPALSVQFAKASGLGARLARNEIFSKVGNFGALGLAGFMSQRFSIHWIFNIAIGFAGLVMLACVLAPRPSLPEKVLAKEAASPREQYHWLDCFKNKTFLKIVVISFLLQLANAPLFMIFEQGYVPLHPSNGAGHISIALILTQLVFVGASFWLAKRTIALNVFNYLAAGLALIALRGLIFVLGLNDLTLALGQLLDGCIAAVIILLPLRAVASLDPLHFNVMSGTIGTAVGCGASLSLLLAGSLVAKYGHSLSVFIFMGVALAALPLAILFRTRAEATT